MDSAAMYRLAYDAHYNRSEFDEAERIYRQVLAEHPDSQEARYARTQLENLAQPGAREVRRAMPSSSPSPPSSSASFQLTPEIQQQLESVIKNGVAKGVLLAGLVILLINFMIAFVIGAAAAK